jgi:hypothetical protein
MVELEHAVHQLEHQARTVAVLLVKRELDVAVCGGELVAEGRSHADAANGASATAVTPDANVPVSAPVRLCENCGNRPAADGRKVCYGCRERQRRERRAQEAATATTPAVEAPAPAYPPEPQLA